VTHTEPRDITQLLQAWSAGDEKALESLIPLVYLELRRLARRRCHGERSDFTLAPTELVHEIYPKLVNQRKADWKNRLQFFSVAARLMRRVLIDHYRRTRAQKRPPPTLRVTLIEGIPMTGPDVVDLIALDAALSKLEGEDPRQATIVELRFFGGLSVEETAEVLGVSAPTIKREWRMAKAWLLRELGGTAVQGPETIPYRR
jgi:RNA polymerase sigma-70 factor (ECF subfamily)